MMRPILLLVWGAAGGCVVPLDDDTDSADTEVTGDVCPGDADCDGLATADDCDDADPESTAVADDGDCDGVLTADDCDDDDASSTTVVEDGDCDGVVSAADCDDADAQSTVKSDDGDCDSVPTAQDCDDADAQAGARPADDPDCDGEVGLVIPPTGLDEPGDEAGFFLPDDAWVAQALYLQADLAGLRPGDEIHGFSLRLDEAEAEDWGVGAAAAFDRFEIWLGEGKATLNTTPGAAFGTHWVGNTKTKVRAGSLTLPADAYAASASLSEAAPWGPAILLDTPYTYTGGNLLVELRHTGLDDDTEWVIDVFADPATRSGGAVYNLTDETATTTDSSWDANWALRLYTDTPP